MNNGNIPQQTLRLSIPIFNLNYVGINSGRKLTAVEATIPANR